MIVLTVVSESDICIPMFVKTSAFQLIKKLDAIVKEHRISSSVYLANILLDFDTVGWNTNELPVNRVTVNFNDCNVKWWMGKDIKELSFDVFKRNT